MIDDSKESDLEALPVPLLVVHQDCHSGQRHH